MIVAAGVDGYERRVAPDGRPDYWPNGNSMEFFHSAKNTDVEALVERRITVTPLFYDLTDASLGAWCARLDGR